MAEATLEKIREVKVGQTWESKDGPHLLLGGATKATVRKILTVGDNLYISDVQLVPEGGSFVVQFWIGQLIEEFNLVLDCNAVADIAPVQ